MTQGVKAKIEQLKQEGLRVDQGKFRAANPKDRVVADAGPNYKEVLNMNKRNVPEVKTSKENLENLDQNELSGIPYEVGGDFRASDALSDISSEIYPVYDELEKNSETTPRKDEAVRSNQVTPFDSQNFNPRHVPANNDFHFVLRRKLFEETQKEDLPTAAESPKRTVQKVRATTLVSSGKSLSEVFNGYFRSFDNEASCTVRGENRFGDKTFDLNNGRDLRSLERAVKKLCEKCQRNLSYERTSDRGGGMTNIKLSVAKSFSSERLEEAANLAINERTGTSRIGYTKGDNRTR